MESEVALLPPSSVPDFHFDSGCSTPYLSAPSSPARIPNFFYSDDHSAIASNFLQQFRQNPSFKNTANNGSEEISLEKKRALSAQEADFAFDFSGRIDAQDDTVFAEELFDEGKIRPLKIKQKPKTEEAEQFGSVSAIQDSEIPPSRSFSSRHETLSFWDLFPFAKQYRKWKLKDLLFRSASEGRSTRQEVSQSDDVTRSSSLRSVESFRSTESGGSMIGSSQRMRRRRARSVSAHYEWHYTLNRAASEERRRRTFLPYRQGLLGCLGVGGRVGSMTRG